MTFLSFQSKIVDFNRNRFARQLLKSHIMGFKAFHSAKATIDGIETAHMIRKGQLSDENIPAYKQFMALAG